MQKTALQEFLEQIVLKQVQGSVYLIPAITDIQIKEALEKEKDQLIEAFNDASLDGDKLGIHYFQQNFATSKY